MSYVAGLLVFAAIVAAEAAWFARRGAREPESPRRDRRGGGAPRGDQSA